MTEISLPCENAKEIMHDAKELKVIGKMTLKDVKNLGSMYRVLDLSQAIFELDREEYSVFLGMSHSGPVYGRTVERTVDVLKRLLEDIEVLTLILPDDVAKRHMNVIAYNDDIYSVEVRETCKLFSMKNGDVFNKKGTILIFEHREPNWATCEDCGETYLSKHLIETGDGRHICVRCRNSITDESNCEFAYETCSCCQKLYRRETMTKGEHRYWLYFCPNCVAKDKHKT